MARLHPNKAPKTTKIAVRALLCAAALAVSTLAATSLATPAFAVTIGNNNENTRQIRLYIVHQSLVSSFEALGNLAGVGVQIDPSIDRVAASVNLQGSTADVFAQLCKQYNLFYWFDGARYNIAPGNTLSRVTIPTGNMDAADAGKIIRIVAPHIAPDAIRFDPDLQVMHILGPKELRDALERAIENSNRKQPNSIAIIRYGHGAQ